MAFETVTGQLDCVQLNKLEVGQKITGYLKSVVAEKNNFDGVSYNLIMIEPETNKEIKVLTGGSAKYVAKNLAAHLGLIPKDPAQAVNEERDAKLFNHLVEIERVGAYKNKRGQNINSFIFRRDPSKTLTTEMATAHAKQVAESVESVDKIPF